MTDAPQRRRRPLRPGPHGIRLKAQVVSKEQLRQLFIDAKITEKVQSGELIPHLAREGDPSPDAEQEEGTKSQYIAYRTREGKTIAEVHQYLKKDGTLGASRKPDPKMLLHEGVLYRVPV